MDFFQGAIKKKLEEIDDERQRWTKQHDVHFATERNLTEFPKSFEIDVMVPIGAKALMPGKLYHTNEIFIGHYSGLFSKCSAHKALEVCKHRIKTAQDHLTALDTEWQMYQDRLELPYTENVFTNNEGQREILEEYSEEEEKQWREEHKKRMAEHKQREAEKRKENQNVDDKDYIAILDNMELMEELEDELETLGIESDEQLQEQLALNIPSMQMRTEQNDGATNASRFANKSARDEIEHPETSETDDDDGDDYDDYEDTNDSVEFQIFYESIKNYTPVEQLTHYKKKVLEVTEYLAQKKVVNYDDLNEKVGKLAFKECLVSAIDKLNEGLAQLPQSSRIIQPIDAKVSVQSSAALINEDIEQSQMHSHFNRKDFARSEKDYVERSKGEQLVFYKSQLRSAIKLIASSSPNIREEEMEERRLLYEYLCGRIDQLRADILKEKQAQMEERFVDDDSDNEIKSNKSDSDDDDDNALNAERSNNDDSDNGKIDGKRRISFADETTITTYHQDDEPWCIHKANDENMKTLMDKTFQFFNSPDNSGDENETNKKCDQLQNTPAAKVEDATGSDTAASTVDDNHTLVIQFNHSSNIVRPTERTADANAILSPADIYRFFAQDEQSSQQDLLRKYVMNVANLNVNEVTERMCNMYANKILQQDQQVVGAGKCDQTNSVQNLNPNLPELKPRKSILKNKGAVSLETHNDSFDFQEENELNDVEMDGARENFSGFHTIVGEIVENSLTTTIMEDADRKENTSADGGVQEINSIDQERDEAPKKPVSLFKRSRKQ